MKCQVSLFKSTIEYLSVRRQNIVDGNFNCIHSPFDRFSKIWAGIEQRKYYLVSANSKVGKTQITDFLFLYHAYRFCKANGIPIKIVYFSLEQDKRTKVIQALSELLYLEKGIRLSPESLRSTREALSEEVLLILKEFEDYFADFLDSVTYVEDIKNPFGIYKYMRQYALDNGVVHTKKVNGEDRFDYYLPNRPEEYVISITDHVSLLTPENGGNVRTAILDLSRYNILLRNNYGQTPVIVQQQASAQESLDNFKESKLAPSFNGLADCKDTQRDIDMAIGLFTPHRHEIEFYKGYDIRVFKDNIRFLNIMGGREGGFGEISPLYFDGAVNLFKELPLPTDKERIKLVYQQLNTIK